MPEDKELFYPEQIYKDKTFEIENYRTDIVYADMSGNTTAEEKARLLENWEYWLKMKQGRKDIPFSPASLWLE